MKNTIILLISAIIMSGHTNDKETNRVIQNFFDTNFQFICSDSTTGKIKLKPLNSQLDIETMSFKFVIPDSVPYSNFYNAYTARLMDVYYKSINTVDKASLDSLLTSPECEIETVNKRVKEHYCKDQVFHSVFKTALVSYYTGSENKGILKLSFIDKIKLSIDSLIQIALEQFDIVSYDTIRGFGYHFVCGVNPYSYSIENNEKLLIPGFCQEALRNKAMKEVHSNIMDELRTRVKEDYPNKKNNIKDLCIEYQNELRKMLLKEGTLKNSLLNYYEKRKNIEPFVLGQ